MHTEDFLNWLYSNAVNPVNEEGKSDMLLLEVSGEMRDRNVTINYCKPLPNNRVGSVQVCVRTLAAWRKGNYGLWS